MIWLVLCILSNTAIFFIFKYINKNNTASLPVIVINYFIAAIIGFLSADNNPEFPEIIHRNWFFLSVIIGILFILMFFVISKSSSEAGISITTVASKMSVVIPIVFSIISDPDDQIGLIKITGILLAIVAVFLTVYQNNSSGIRNKAIFYPLILFIGMGLVDSLVKYAQFNYVSNEELSHFSALLFSISFLSGLIIILSRKKDLVLIVKKKVLSWGIFLGIVNFGSVYFLVRALNYSGINGSGIDGSIVFGINNTGIVILSVLTGLIIFNEKLSRLNKAGVLLSILAIIVFSYA